MRVFFRKARSAGLAVRATAATVALVAVTLLAGGWAVLVIWLKRRCPR